MDVLKFTTEEDEHERTITILFFDNLTNTTCSFHVSIDLEEKTIYSHVFAFLNEQTTNESFIYASNGSLTLEQKTKENERIHKEAYDLSQYYRKNVSSIFHYFAKVCPFTRLRLMHLLEFKQ